MPRYVQFPRSNVAGKVPDRIDPGSFTVNWADRKIYTGGPNGEPILMSYRLSDYDSTRSYRQQDVAYFGGSLWRCTVAFATGTFNPAQWEELSDVTTAPYKELSGTVWVSGGILSIEAGGLRVGAGSGVVMALSNAQSPIISKVSWVDTLIPEPHTSANASVVVGIDGNGVLAFLTQPALDPSWRRRHVVLGAFTTDEVGMFVSVDNVGVQQHQTKETLADLLNIIGPTKVEGVDLQLGDTNTARISSGKVFWQGLEPGSVSPNIIEVPTVQIARVRQVDRAGYTESGALSDTFDPTKWDNGSSPVPVPPGSFTNQFIVLTPDLSTGIAIYGQKLYASLDAAISDVASAWEELDFPQVATNSILVGAVSTDGSGGLQVVTSSEIGFGNPFGGAGGGGDTSQFLVVTGTRPMEADFDLGTFGLTNGEVDGEKVDILPEVLTATGEAGELGTLKLAVNTEDDKVFIGSQVVADRTDLYSPAREYLVGDRCIQNNNLYRCTTAITTPEAFNPAKWQLIGADNSGALAQAIIIDPDTPTRNTIDVTGGGGLVPALRTAFDNSQSVDLYEFSPNARISRFGIPTNAFGEAVFRVSQVNHLFTAVGTLVYYDGSKWTTASSTDVDLFPQAMVHQIIDGDNFLLQVGGRINNLSPAAFVGGTPPVPGTFYYASETPGRMTAVEGATPVPALYATSTTSGIVKVTGTRIPKVITPDEVIDHVYPVGSVYLSIDPANPSTRWPGTEWVQQAAGRALVGVGNNGQSDWTVGQTRGSESHVLTQAEMPAHAHIARPPYTETTLNGQHGHYGNFGYLSSGLGSPTGNPVSISISGGSKDKANVNIPEAGNHIHGVSIPAFWTDNTGSNAAHNNVQPSIGVYVWQRTA